VSDHRNEPTSAFDVAYDYIEQAGDDWTRDGLAIALARAGFPLDDDAAIDDIIAANLERLESESILSEATDMFLRQNRFRDLRHAAEQMDCTVEEVADFIARRANVIGGPFRG
jgi:hypothetical protein